MSPKFNSITVSRKIAIPAGIAIIILAIIALLMTRQILAYNNDTETVMFVMTIVIGYGFGSWRTAPRARR